MLLQVYAEKRTNRLEYTLDLVLRNILGVQYIIKTEFSELEHHNPILNYSSKPIENALQIVPHKLLFEESIEEQNIIVENDFFFKTSDAICAYDLLASSFYMATRYEEYLETNLDNHGRFQAENSLAYKNKFLKKAVVHRWAINLRKVLLKKYPKLTFKLNSYAYLSTIDVDAAYAFKAKGFNRLVGGLLKAILRQDFADIKARLSFMFLGKKDPFDVYNDLSFWHKKYQTSVKYFFPVGENGPFDKNIKASKTAYKNLIKTLSAEATVGLHPSYQSNNDYNILLKEKQILSDITETNIDASRQHFLKLSFPFTYQKLIKSGFRTDYTLGFASQVGFRSGMCVPYQFFDLSSNTAEDLTIIPFQIMDGTLSQYLSLSLETAWQEMEDIYKEVKLVDGLFVTLWHNESLSEMRNWKGWKSIYPKMLEKFAS